MVLLLSLSAVTAAHSADISSQPQSGAIEPSLEQSSSASFWNGVYTGLQTEFNWQSVGVMGGSDIDNVKGIGAGGFIGYNQYLGNSLVGGVELQGAFSNADNSVGGNNAEQDWETSLRARMGYAFEQNLIYGLAGVVATRLEVNNGANSDRNWLTGWMVGAGVERAFTENIFGRVEYDYSNYGSKSFNLGATTSNVELNGHEVKLGVGLKF